MRYTKFFAGFALAAGMLFAGASTLSAQEWGSRYGRNYQQNYRQDYRYDSRRVEALRRDIARDRARLNEDIRRGRQSAASRDAADLARDQRELSYLLRDNRREWR